MDRWAFLDQEENQWSSLRIGPPYIVVSPSSIPQLTLEALAGVRMELPGRHTCSQSGSLTRANIPGGEDTEVAESPRRPSWREGSIGNMDWLSIGGGTMDPTRELYRSEGIPTTNEARLSRGRD